jgi:hypothetical protein
VKITNKWLKEKHACREGSDWFNAQKETNAVKLVKKLMIEKHFDWANWLIVRIMERKQYLAYAIFAAREVLRIFEEKYPNDNRPRKAIEAAEKCLADDSSAARAAAWAAARDAGAAAWAAWAAGEEMQGKIINYGIKLLEPGK